MEPPKEIYLIRDAANPKKILGDIASEKPMFSDDIKYIRADLVTPNDLEKAARKSAIAPFNLDIDEEHLDKYPYLPIAEQKFIEGVKWQKGQDLAEMAQSKSPLSVAYANRCFENGKQAMKEQMMKEAVEGKITKDNRGNNVLRVGLFNNGFEIGDKVRIIIVKE